MPEKLTRIFALGQVCADIRVMEIRSILITVIVLVVVGLAAVATQFSDRLGPLRERFFGREGQKQEEAMDNNNTSSGEESLAQESAAPANETDNGQPASSPATETEDRQGSLAEAENVNPPEESPLVAGAHDVEVTADTGASEFMMILAIAAVLLGGAGMVASQRRI